MKKTKRFIGFLLVVQMMLMCTFIPGAMAADVVTETPVESENAEMLLTIPADTVVEAPVEDPEELMPMMASRCIDDTEYDDTEYDPAQYDDIVGLTFNNTAEGLQAGGFSFSGSGKNGITFTDNRLTISQEQMGTEFCVFVYYNDMQHDMQLTWFKVRSW